MKHLELSFTSSMELFGYTDSDWAGSLDDRRSTSGFTYIYGGGAVSWSSKKGKSVVLSMAEAEYIAAAQVAKEVIWFRMLLEELRYLTTNIPTIILVDNQSCIALAKNPSQHARTKHIDIY